MQYIFLDTNIFIHFVSFEQIDWEHLTDSAETVVIVIAPMVLEELDKHKYNRNAKIAQKVKKLLPKLEKAHNNEVALRYKVQLILKRPSESIFVANNLDKSVQDDNLLASIIDFKESLAGDQKVLLVTHDVGPRLKAKSLDIAVTPLDDKYLLTNEPDELEIKNRVLQKEINELKNRIPDVDLCFSDKSRVKMYQRQQMDFSREEFVETEVEKVLEEHPYMIFNSASQSVADNTFAGLTSHPMFALSKSEVNDYNQKLSEYLDEYAVYANGLYSEHYFNKNSIKIELRLENSGTAPAEDIDIDIHFPDGFELLTESNFPERKLKPKPPYRPKNRLDIPNFSTIFPRFNPHDSMSGISETLKLNQPSIKRTNSYNVKFHFDGLKHHQFFDLEPLYAVFDDIMKAKGFEMEYKLIISNLAKPVSGKLNVHFKG